METWKNSGNKVDAGNENDVVMTYDVPNVKSFEYVSLLNQVCQDRDDAKANTPVRPEHNLV